MKEKYIFMVNCLNSFSKKRINKRKVSKTFLAVMTSDLPYLWTTIFKVTYA